MPPRDNNNGSIHGMSLLVGELKAAIEHLNNNWKMKDAEAARRQEKLADKFDALRSDVQAVKGSVEAVQQDVAEMKNDLVVHAEKLESIETNRPVVMAAIGEIHDLKQFRLSLEKREQRALGWWDACASIGGIGWTAIGSIAAAALGLLVYWLQRKI